jgi:FkbM family methyltransferase
MINFRNILTRIVFAINLYFLKSTNFVVCYIRFKLRSKSFKNESIFLDNAYKYSGKRKTRKIKFNNRILITPWFPLLRVQLRAFFVDREYDFDLPENPVILDCGGNIGISSIYFWLRYNPSKLITFEADKYIFDNYLTPNLNVFNVDCERRNEAVWFEDTELKFDSTGFDSGNINPNGDINVKAVNINKIIEKFDKIDLMKIDIEGAEYQVMINLTSFDKINNFYIEVECQKNSNKNIQLLKILNLLISANYEVLIASKLKSSKPYENFSSNSGDIVQYTNIYARKR